MCPGPRHSIVVDWPASPAVDETFKLFYNFDQPRAAGFSANSTNPIFRSYLQNAPLPPDQRFSGSAAPNRSPPPGGADALKDWLDNRLASPKNVTIGAHASFEGDASAAKTTHNNDLSNRRLAVARGIIASRATITQAGFFGFSRAQAAGRVGNQDDRVAEIIGKVPGADPRCRSGRRSSGRPSPSRRRLRHRRPSRHLRRHRRPHPLRRTSSPPPPPAPPPPPPPPPPAAGGEVSPALVSFKLKFVHQEERKDLVVIYDRKKAVKQSSIPKASWG